MQMIPEVSGAECREAIHAAVERARMLDILVSVAFVDGGGNLKAFYRMDGAEIAGPVLAIDKAYTSVANRIETQALAQECQPGGALFGLQANGGGRFVVFGGGVPVWVAGRVIGALGVSGGTAEEDAECAQAGLAALQDSFRRE